MMKTESFNWQRPTKICNGVKDFGLLREKLANTDDIKRRGFSSIYISRAVFIVGVIAIITFVICLVLADKYQKSIDLSHHYASFVYENEKSHDERSYYGRNRENQLEKEPEDTVDAENDFRKGSFNTSSFVRLQNLSNKLPIEEINLLLPVTTVLRSLNVSRNGRQFWGSAGADGEDFQKTRQAIVLTTKNPSQSAPTAATAATTAAAKKHRIQSLADLLRRTELKKSVTSAPSSNRTEGDSGEKTPAAVTEQAFASAKTNKSVPMVVAGTQTSIHFAQLESYPRRTHNNNLQQLIEYINCQSSNDCWSQQNRNEESETVPGTQPNLPQTSATAASTWQRDVVSENPHRPDGYNGGGSEEVEDAAEKPFIQTITHHQHEKDTSPWSTVDDNTQSNGNEYVNNDGNGDNDETPADDDVDTMFTADTQPAPLYYSPAALAPYLTIPIHGNRISSDPFRNFRASSPVEINRLQLHDQTESAAGVSVTAAAASEQSFHQPRSHHRFSNRMYRNRDNGGGPGVGDNFETYSLDLDPYLKPPTPPPPTMLSFTPSYTTTTIFHSFNDPSASGSGSALREHDLRSEASAVEPVASQVKPISLMVEIFPANEYELPAASIFGGNGNVGVSNFAGASTDASSSNSDGGNSHLAAFAAQQREQIFGSIGGANSNRAIGAGSSMSWKLAPFTQNKMRLLVNLFPQHDRDASAPAIG